MTASARAPELEQYRVNVERSTKLIDRVFGTRYTVSVYRKGPHVDHYVGVEIVARLSQVRQAAGALIWRDWVKARIVQWDIGFDFEVPR